MFAWIWDLREFQTLRKIRRKYFSYVFFMVLKWTERKFTILTIFKCTMQWHSAHSHSCAAVATVCLPDFPMMSPGTCVPVSLQALVLHSTFCLHEEDVFLRGESFVDVRWYKLSFTFLCRVSIINEFLLNKKYHVLQCILKVIFCLFHSLSSLF